MKTKSSLVILAVAVAFVAFLGIALAQDDVIEMKADYEHTKGIVQFTHAKHMTDYEIGCGECHHDAEGKPLEDLKAGDAVQRCIDCHSKPGEIKGKDAKGMSDAEKRQYHANALHDNCIDCHRQYNRDNKTKAAPTTCTKCHPRDK